MRKSQAQALRSTSPVKFDSSNWAWRLSQASLREIRHLSRSAGTPFVVLYLNDYSASSPAPIARENGEVLQAFCEGEGIPDEDLRPRLVAQHLHEHRHSPVDGHPDATGHHVLAGVLSASLFGEGAPLSALTHSSRLPHADAASPVDSAYTVRYSRGLQRDGSRGSATKDAAA